MNHQLTCCNCGEKTERGGIVDPELGFFCWKLECEKKWKQLDKEQHRLEKIELQRSNQCLFYNAYQGYCKKPVVQNGVCEEHKKIQCNCCKEQAVRECPTTGLFVCGIPLCDKCNCPIH